MSTVVKKAGRLEADDVIVPSSSVPYTVEVVALTTISSTDIVVTWRRNDLHSPHFGTTRYKVYDDVMVSVDEDTDTEAGNTDVANADPASRNSYALLGILQAFAPTGTWQQKLADDYNEMRKDGMTEDEVLVMLGGTLMDGLKFGNWPWVLETR